MPRSGRPARRGAHVRQLWCVAMTVAGTDVYLVRSFEQWAHTPDLTQATGWFAQGDALVVLAVVRQLAREQAGARTLERDDFWRHVADGDPRVVEVEQLWQVVER